MRPVQRNSLCSTAQNVYGTNLKKLIFLIGRTENRIWVLLVLVQWLEPTIERRIYFITASIVPLLYLH